MRSLWLSVGAGPARRVLNSGQVEMPVLVGRVTNVSVREDECLKNRAIHGLKDRIECSKLETNSLRLRKFGAS